MLMVLSCVKVWDDKLENLEALRDAAGSVSMQLYLVSPSELLYIHPVLASHVATSQLLTYMQAYGLLRVPAQV